ncbi:flavodoxin family protein [Desulfovibrio desulfuricans]|uniref:flavodoxin family protein n=1 Tax=Desulfovibrio desulfuricans TaxID=876 RepID=UPI001AE2C412|nr:flavodoxin family protein [Desulfovibrio desulfuricans]MDD3683586.1 flavodoxin family protein [Desulfovibrio desulfuricans]QTO39917.1 flavodoxin family protein [Desulfovibrio desulfuricans]
MNKRICILAGSPRKNGNSAMLCNEFARGAKDGGHSVETIFLRDKKIGYCLACYHCKKSEGVCAINDDMADILDKINAADVIVMASPVYFYSIDAQMKALIDRCVARWLTIKDKTFYYIMTAAEDSVTVMDCTLDCFRGLAKCLSGSIEGGVLYGKGVYEAGAIKKLPIMKKAYEMGRSVS